MSNVTLQALKARKLAHALRIAGRIVSEGNARELAQSLKLAAQSDRRVK